MSKLSSRLKRRVKQRLSGEKPTIWVGKAGVSEELIGEIRRQLEKREMVKVKILRSALEGNEAKKVALAVASQTEASLIEVRGHTFMLYKRRKK
ncbi:MAG: YhbY family RNA-binding protein [Candidatus Bathyarchaeia archaeon]